MSSYQLSEDQDYIKVHLYEAQEDWEDAGRDSTRSSTPGHLKAEPPSTRSSKGRGKEKRSKATTTAQSGSDTEKETSKMSSRVSRHSSSGSRRDRTSSKIKKTDDWTDVTEPDERRRIQNRIAQRKFREKAREQKDRAQREAQNQQYAGSAYHIPDADDITFDDGDLSGLPWGGINMRHVVARGHASASTHTQSHYSGYSAENRRDSALSSSHTTAALMAAATTTAAGSMTPDLVDTTLYSLNPYGYPVTALPPAYDPRGDAASSVGGGDVAGSSSYYGSPAYGGYYDYDPSGGVADHGAHPM